MNSIKIITSYNKLTREGSFKYLITTSKGFILSGYKIKKTTKIRTSIMALINSIGVVNQLDSEGGFIFINDDIILDEIKKKKGKFIKKHSDLLSILLNVGSLSDYIMNQLSELDGDYSLINNYEIKDNDELIDPRYASKDDIEFNMENDND